MKKISTKEKKNEIIDITYQLATGAKYGLYALGIFFVFGFIYVLLQSFGIVK